MEKDYMEKDYMKKKDYMSELVLKPEEIVEKKPRKKQMKDIFVVGKKRKRENI